MACKKCYSLMISGGDKVLVCKKCGFEEAIESAVIRSVEELKFLFPDLKITTNLVFEWCQVVKSKKMIRRVLNENYKTIGYGRWFYYE